MKLGTLVVVGALALAACGDDGGTAGGAGGGTACTPGEQRACACPGGGEGVQVCLDDGSRLGPCEGCGGQGGGTGGGGGGGGEPATPCEAAAAHALECGLTPWPVYEMQVTCGTVEACAAECFANAPCEAFDYTPEFDAYEGCVAACGQVCHDEADCPPVGPCEIACTRVWATIEPQAIGTCGSLPVPAGNPCPGGACDGMGTCVLN